MDVREKARLTWHCRRGMLELDLILQRFMDAKIDELNEQELNSFDLLLNYTDPELFSWLMGHTDPEDKALYDIVTLIRTNY
ncbi:MAG TPA: succinate dehydrogenase assembly factor 2 [Legionella sp.]|nr:succinate dehydrogenase assembly factor 2 [Legionella sp.]